MSISQAVRLIFKEAFDPFRLMVYAPEDQADNKAHSNISVAENDAVPIHENIPSLVQSEVEVLMALEPGHFNPEKRDKVWKKFRQTLTRPDLKTALEGHLQQTLKHVTLASIFAEIEDNKYIYTGKLAVTYFLDPETLNSTN